MNKKLIVILTVLIGFWTVDAADNDPDQFWVRTDGNDSCSGQENLSYANNQTDCAWATIQKAADTLSTGQKVRVQAGTYYETIKIWNDDANDHNNTIFKGDGYPLVACTDGSTSWDGMTGFEITKFNNPSTLVQNVTITGFRIENCTTGIRFTGNYTNISYNIIGGPRNKGYSRKDIERGISLIAIYSGGSYLRWSFSNSYIGHNTINTTMYKFDGTSTSGVTSGVDFSSVTEETNVTVEYNTIDQGEWATQTEDGTGVAIAMGGMPWSYLESCYKCNEPVNRNMKIQHNTILGSSRNCIAGNSIDSLYYNNTLKRCWHNGIDMHSVWNANVSYNEIYEIVDGPSAPIYTSWGYENSSKASGGRVVVVKNITIHDNYIHDSTRAAAIKAENVYNMTAYNNVFYNVTAALSMWANVYYDHDAVCGQRLLYNNTINYTTGTNGYAYLIGFCADTNSTIEDNNEIAALVSINDTFYNVTNLIQTQDSNQSVYIINPRWESPTTGKSLYDNFVFRIYSGRYAERGMYLAWFADVQVQNTLGNNISGATVTFTPNASYEGRNTAISLEGFIDNNGKPIINRLYNLSPRSLSYTLTGADGHTPAWPNSTWTPVIIDSVKIYNGSYPLQYFSWDITASKSGYASNSTTVDPDSSLYRSDPNTHQNTTLIILQEDSTPPTKPSLISPNNNSWGNSTPVLNWTTVTEANFKNYTIELDNNQDFSSPEYTYTTTDINDSNYTVTSAISPGKYYWRVTAWDTAGNGNTSDYFIYYSEQINSCGTISSPGVYYLIQDISSSDLTCVQISSSNVVFDGQGYLLNGSEVTNSYGIRSNSSGALTNITIENVTISNWYIGVYFYKTSNSMIRNNTFRGNDVFNAITISWVSENNTITNNTFSNNVDVIRITRQSKNTTVITNNISRNVGEGVYVSSTDNTSILNNTLIDSSDWHGIYLVNSNYTYVQNNIIKNNSIAGIEILNSTQTVVTNNDFNNTINIKFSGETYGNTWNTTKTLSTNILGEIYIGGNYWGKPDGTGFSDTCTDTNEDGICDTNYTLAAGNIDYLPLTHAVPYRLYLNAPVSNYNTSNQSVVFNWTCYDAIDTSLNSNLTIDGTVNVSNITTSNATATVQQVDGLSESLHNWSITCYNSFGNANTSATRDFTVDLTAPTFSNNQPPSATGGTATNITIDVVDSLTAIDTVNASVKFPSSAVRTYIMLLQANNTYYFTTSESDMTDGIITVNVSANDTAGNVANTSFTVTVPQSSGIPGGGGGGGTGGLPAPREVNYSIVILSSTTENISGYIVIYSDYSYEIERDIMYTLLTGDRWLDYGTWNNIPVEEGYTKYPFELENISFIGTVTLKIYSPKDDISERVSFEITAPEEKERSLKEELLNISMPELNITTKLKEVKENIITKVYGIESNTTLLNVTGVGFTAGELYDLLDSPLFEIGGFKISSLKAVFFLLVLGGIYLFLFNREKVLIYTGALAVLVLYPVFGLKIVLVGGVLFLIYLYLIETKDILASILYGIGIPAIILGWFIGFRKFYLNGGHGIIIYLASTILIIYLVWRLTYGWKTENIR